MPKLVLKKKRSDEDDEPVKKKARYTDDDEDEDERPVKKKTRYREDDDDEDERPKKKAASGKAPKTSGKGWGAVANKKIANEERGDSGTYVKDFYLKDGESAIIQFIDDEPVCMDGHSVPDTRTKFRFEPCQLAIQKHCLMCREKLKLTWKAAFKILDYRGNWDKEKKRFKHDGPIEKIWYVSNSLAMQIKGQKDKKGKDLSDLVFEVTRNGSGAKDTTYNFEIAFDKKDRRMSPIEWEEKFPPTEDIFKPKSDEELIKAGFGDAEDLEDDDDLI